MSALSFQIGWVIWLVYFALLEGAALRSGLDKATLSAMVRTLRFETFGRPAILILWCWLTVHWILRPKWNTGIGWRDGVGMVVGALVAYWELARK